MDFILTIAILILVIGLLVFVHELGHFLAAKLTGTMVIEFAIGFGPLLWKKHWKGTDYMIRALPLGGYVRMEGDDGEVTESQSNYLNKPILSKVFILVAGVTMNFILACLLLAIYLAHSNYLTGFQKITEYNFIGTSEVYDIPRAVYVAKTIEGKPAYDKLTVGDAIISINGEGIDSLDSFLGILDANQGKEISVEVFSTDTFDYKKVVIMLDSKETEDDSILGIAPIFDSNRYYYLKYPQSVFSGVSHSVNAFGYQIKALGDMLSKSLHDRDVAPVADQIGGVVAVTDIVGDIVSINAYSAIINLTALFSLSLAFVNLLPIPVMDGGQVVLEIIQSIRRKRFSTNTLGVINTVSFAFLILLFVVITLKDIAKIDLLNNIISGIKSVFGQ